MSGRVGGSLIHPELRAALDRAIGGKHLLVASDFDGTLSPIVDDPSRAIPHERGMAAFRSVAMRAGVRGLIISGRQPEVLEKLVRDSDGITLIGNHGADVLAASHDDAAVRALTAAFDDIAVAIDGALVESKSTGAAFHYRHTSEPAIAAERARAVARSFGARILEGKFVVEASLAEGDKGSALQATKERWAADRVVFFGDDITDEHAFATLGDDDVGVKVGGGATAARYRVDDPDGVADSLEVLDRLLAATGR